MTYEITKAFPKEELFGLSSQMRRAATSIASNIAEGSQRGSGKDFAHFLLIAKGSLAELHTQIIIAKNVSIVTEATADTFIENMQELDKMLRSFHRKILGKPTSCASILPLPSSVS